MSHAERTTYTTMNKKVHDKKIGPIKCASIKNNWIGAPAHTRIHKHTHTYTCTQHHKKRFSINCDFWIRFTIVYYNIIQITS